MEVTTKSNEAQPRARAAKSGRNDVRRWGGVGFAILLLAIFGAGVRQWVRYAAHSEVHSYVLLIPVISGYLLWLRWQALPSFGSASWPLSLGAFFLGGLVSSLRGRVTFPGLGGSEGDLVTAAMVGLFLFLVAGGFCFLGREWMQAAGFPVVFALFAVPLPPLIVDHLEVLSQHASAEAAALFFAISGTPVLRQGLVFLLPGVAIEVAQECSGIRSSLVLVITGLLAAHLLLNTFWRRAILVSLVVPLGILRNGFRVFVIGELCSRYGPQMARSPIHTRGGPLFFVISLIPLAIALWLLRSGEMKQRKSGQPGERVSF